MMMKIVSPKKKYKDDDIYQDITSYVTNPQKCYQRLITERNLSYGHYAEDMYQLANKYGKLKGTRIRHVVVTFEKNETDVHTVFDIAQWACDYYKNEYQVFAAVHENTDHLHFHMIMNTVGIKDGKKYRGRKKDFYPCIVDLEGRKPSTPL